MAIGIILMGLFLYQVASGEKWGALYNRKFTTTSCDAVMIKIDKKIPANWRSFCEGNNLAVEINELSVPPDAKNLKSLMYRQLANHMSYIARTSHTDILEKVDFVRFRVAHPKMEINAVTEGKFIVKLATLETPEHIMTHLQSTVQVKENIK